MNPNESAALRPSSDTFSVFVDDNFTYMNESKRYLLRAFGSYDEALTTCRQIVDDFLLASSKSGMSAEALYAAYIAFGEEPFISPDIGAEPFSAREYARSRCADLQGR